MPRTVVSLPPEDKSWLDLRAKTEGVAMTELVRRAVREYRTRHARGELRRVDDLLEQTRGCWKQGDGLRYQDTLRDGWEERR